VKVERRESPREFAAQVAAHLTRFAQPDVPLPSDAELVELIDAMFFASLYEEEARRAEFGVAWQPAPGGCLSVVAMTPLPATPANLAKLAPSTREEATSIAVRRDDGGLVAWALLEQNANTLQPLIIRALGSGVLRVDYAGVARALYARGEIYLAGRGHDVISPSQVLTKTFDAWRDGASDPARIDPRAGVVTRLAARALEHQHGGMILIVPAEVTAPVGVRMHYEVADGASVLARRYAEVIRDSDDRLQRLYGSRARGLDGRVSVRDEAQIAFAEAVELVARLTAIDNAVLLDTDLRLRAFGVQVLEGDAPHMTFEHADPYTGSRHLDDLATFKGTRHPAGVIFCMRQPREAAAIIASQDGHLSLAIKNASGTVEVIGSYERAFGWS
jgi:hypothetical protein